MCSISTNRCAGCPWARPSPSSGCRRARSPMSVSTIDPATMNIRGRVEIVSYPERLVARLSAKQAAIGKMLRGQRTRAPGLHAAPGRAAGAARAAPQRQPAHRAALCRLRLTSRTRPRRRSTGAGTVRSCRWSRAPFRTSRRKLTNIVAKLDKLPLEAIGADLRKALASLDQTLKMRARQ